jgi:uncharacterized repeat protein (TIGR02543 family)
MPSTEGFTRNGYVNDGKWYTSSAGTTEFVFGTGGTAVTANTTLYLKWTPTYTVSFSLGGGSGYAPASIAGIVQGDTLSTAQMPSTEGFTRNGYVNDGKWYTGSAGTTEFVFGTGGTAVMANTTLYLKWVPSYTISFNPNGGSGTASLFGTTGLGGTLASLPVPVRYGYDFDGWFTAAKGGTAVTTSTVFGTDSTIYAHWVFALPTPTLPKIATGSHIAQNRNGIDLMAKTDATIEIYNLGGKLISRQSYIAGNHGISLGHLPKGIYLIRARFATTAETLRLTIH